MKKFLPVFVILFISLAMMPPLTGKDVLKKMYDRYSGKWYKTLSFDQTTERYRNDSLKRTETWFERIDFPKKFRIDFDNPDSGNAVIFRNDSSYIFRNSGKIRESAYKNDLLFLVGGMYFYSFDEMASQMQSYGFDLYKFHEDIWKGKGVYVIGASKNEDSISNQIWVEKEHYNIVRMLKFDRNQKEEALFDNYVKLAGGYLATLVHFYVNNKLVQVEKYHDLKTNTPLDKTFFDPNNFVKIKLQ